MPRPSSADTASAADTADTARCAGSGCRLRLAGAPAVEVAQRTVPLQPVDAALLAWLALRGATPRGRLAELLWPGSEAEAARGALRQRLYKLRQSLGVDLVAGTQTLALAPSTPTCRAC